MERILKYTHIPGNLGNGQGGNCFTTPDLAKNLLMHGALMHAFDNPEFCKKWSNEFGFEIINNYTDDNLSELALVSKDAGIRFGTHTSVNKSDYTDRLYDPNRIQEIGTVQYTNSTPNSTCSDNFSIMFGVIDNSQLTDEQKNEVLSFARGIETFSNMPYFLAKAYDRVVVNNDMPTSPKQFRTFFFKNTGNGELERIVEDNMQQEFIDTGQDIAISVLNFGILAKIASSNPDDKDYIQLRTRVESEQLLQEKLHLLVEHKFLPNSILRMYGLAGYY